MAYMSAPIIDLEVEENNVFLIEDDSDTEKTASNQVPTDFLARLETTRGKPNGFPGSSSALSMRISSEPSSKKSGISLSGRPMSQLPRHFPFSIFPSSSTSSKVDRKPGSLWCPIDLEDGLTTEIARKKRDADQRFTQPRRINSDTSYSTIQPGGSDEVPIEIDDDEEEEIATNIACRNNNMEERRESKTVYPQRNLPIVSPYFICEKVAFKSTNQYLRPGNFVELEDEGFLQITHIIRNSLNMDDTMLRGYLLQRTHSMNGMLEMKCNELCFHYEIELDDPRDVSEQSMYETPLSTVQRIRNVRVTNQKFPLDRLVNLENFQSQVEAYINGGLTVRWKYICKYATAKDRRNNNRLEQVIQHINDEDMNGKSKASDAKRRQDWRGEANSGDAYRARLNSVNSSTLAPGNGSVMNITSDSSELEVGPREYMQAQPGGFRNAKKRKSTIITQPAKRACFERVKETMEGIEVINLDTDEEPFKAFLGLRQDSLPLHNPPALPLSSMISSSSPMSSAFSRLPGQMLTYGDAFCGAGGTTRGAVMAGLRIKWGFDFSSPACETWRSNFPYAKCHQLHSGDFVRKAQRLAERGAPDTFKVDILHLSPPCQYFSVAHTVNGKDDDANVASLFAVREVIQVAKPRIVTLEQTAGIITASKAIFLAAVIQMFTALGFSLRWKVVHLAEWGLPQRRRRLIIIAACPGEALPEFPAATHSKNGEDRLKPFVSVNQTLRQIPANAPDHNIAAAKLKAEAPWDGDQILPRTMTCSGGQNYHPSGKRDFTDREYAALQGFPENHWFKGTYIKRQIGNAVPPCIAKVLFESIKKTLNNADGIEEEHETLLIE